ncbi:hypothetical protein PGT21_037042 [Puccinia graminis f. sp. tritici]|uniref:Uncharacterized protein n=1 Tax=Puccinia graminis f. sp. tritici TaxID=56615 RepID=A0A5B0QRQ5_PUCGR|nr:hypothetical protein PGT21_037042 [Puccinia graminis f. sp. tritici]
MDDDSMGSRYRLREAYRLGLSVMSSGGSSSGRETVRGDLPSVRAGFGGLDPRGSFHRHPALRASPTSALVAETPMCATDHKSRIQSAFLRCSISSTVSLCWQSGDASNRLNGAYRLTRGSGAST